MNDDVIDDLKQFITATVKQEISVATEKIDKLGAKLSGKIDDLSKSVAETMDSNNENVDIQLADHEEQLTLIEQKAA